MRLLRVKDQKEGGRLAFALLKEKIDSGIQTIGLATGSSPLSFYQELVDSSIDFSKLTSINLDEYVGLSPDNPQSYSYFMKEHLLESKPFKESFLPNGLAKDLLAEASNYDRVLDEHPIDFQILGIGRNGHIGFNEPGTSFEMTTHLVDLTEDTIQANSRFFDKSDDVPRQAISMGIASIMTAKTIVLMAYGIEKAVAIKGMIYGPVTEDLPASILQKHPDVIVILDEAAASQL
ncbi:glucosamine-6-phosphate deaminase [Streptococcus saliviloxodontae]|uniref:Glucosamine-6-phosphate deaminase n=1 Tax=Streptococcus saliviloxodontae TaxID=1349416 RepID=A0ABS2PMA9_9STRE|nr:glucosamine-6-phosphate deaminase [Streptococcus saliviloxodontae]MBM7636575.1 glucosamine-6-phosphate deaminase [Streptococcus saliviloxodontae]